MDYFHFTDLDLPADIWSPFAHQAVITSFAPGQMIYFQDSRADCFYYLKQGQVKTFISSEEGTEKVLHIYQPGNLFGEAAFFDELPRVSSAIAMTVCQIVKIDRQMAQRELAAHPEMALAMLKYLARTVRLLSAHVDDMAFLQAHQRIARYLLSSGAQDGRLHSTQEEIASAVSASRVTVSRILNRFAKQGWISLGYGQIEIRQPEKLAQQLEV